MILCLSCPAVLTCRMQCLRLWYTSWHTFLTLGSINSTATFDKPQNFKFDDRKTQKEKPISTSFNDRRFTKSNKHKNPVNGNWIHRRSSKKITAHKTRLTDISKWKKQSIRALFGLLIRPQITFSSFFVYFPTIHAGSEFYGAWYHLEGLPVDSLSTNISKQTD